MVPHPSSNRKAAPLLAALLLLAFVAIRCFALEADTPLTIGEHSARELFAEPPAKSHEARNFALFGAWQLNPLDNYQFWRAQSPAWAYPLAYFFKAFGVGYAQLRLFSILLNALGFAALLYLASTALRPAAWSFAGAAVAFDAVYFHTSRVGVLEPAVTSWITWAMLCLLAARRHAGFLLLVPWACLVAFLTKQAAVHIVPVVGVGTLVLLFKGAGIERHKVAFRSAVVLQGLILLGLLAWHMDSDAYHRAFMHNVDHVLVRATPGAPKAEQGLAWLVQRVSDTQRYEHFLVTLPITGPVALLTMTGWLARLLIWRRLPSALEWIAGGWFACACIAMLVVAQSTFRFWTLAVYPAALVSAAGIEGLYHWGQARRLPILAKGLWVSSMLLVLTVNGKGFAEHVFSPAYTVRDAANTIEAKLGKTDATIVGFLAPGMVLGTPYRNFYVRAQFNTKPSVFRALGVTHLLIANKQDDVRRAFIRSFPGAMDKLKPLATLPVRTLRVKLFDVSDVAQRKVTK